MIQENHLASFNININIKGSMKPILTIQILDKLGHLAHNIHDIYEEQILIIAITVFVTLSLSI